MKPTPAEAAIDALAARFFALFDNRNGARPDLAALTACFSEKATIVRRSTAGSDLYSVAEFAVPRVELLTRGALRDFHERETSATTQVFDGIASRVSRYAKSGVLDGAPYGGTGTKCFHFARIGAEWRITAIAWVDDEP